MNNTHISLTHITNGADIAQAVATLQPLLAKTEIYFTDLEMESKGFVYSKDGKEIFISYNKTRKRISEFVYQMNSDELTDHDILEAVLLLALEEELVGDYKACLTDEAVWPEIALKFKELVDKNILSIPVISKDRFEYDKNKAVYVLTEALQPDSPAEETEEVEVAVVPEEREETVVAITKTVVMPKEDIIDEKEEVNVFEQTSLFGEEVAVEPKKTTKSRKKTTKKKEVQEKPPMTMEEALAKATKYFDDEWAREKLESFDDIPTKLIDYVIAFRKKQREILTPEDIALIPNNTKYTGWSEPLRHVLAAYLGRSHQIIRGESSTGKTTLTKTACALLNYPMTFAGASIDTSIDDLIGVNTLEDGSVGVINAPLITAMKGGFAFLLDEANAASPNVLVRLHSAIDDERTIFNMLTGEQIFAHENFLMVCNINDGYIGTNDMGEGTVDRFVGIQTKYMNEEQMEAYLKNFPGLFTEFQKEVLNLGDLSDDEIYQIIDIAIAIQDATKDILPEKMGSLRNINELFKLTPLLGMKDVVKMIVRKYVGSERDKLASVISQVESLDMTADDILAI